MDGEYPLKLGVGYPRTQQEFDARFATEADCEEFLYGLRWPEGFECSRCGARVEPWITSRGYRHCKPCGAEIAVTAGTLFEGTTKSLRDFFKAIWLITGRYGTNALDLKRVLRLGSYQTAWTWHHKIRRAMGGADRDGLSGTVEVQRALFGTPERDVHDREAKDRVMIAVAAERRGRKIGRIRLRRITDASAETRLAFVKDAVTPGSVLITDASPDYSGLDRLGYHHKISNVKSSGASSDKLLPRVQYVVLQLEKWLRTTHRNGQQRYLDSYLDEFMFHFNSRAYRSHGLLFYRLMQQAATLKPAPYRSIVGDARSRCSGLTPARSHPRTRKRLTRIKLRTASFAFRVIGDRESGAICPAFVMI